MRKISLLLLVLVYFLMGCTPNERSSSISNITCENKVTHPEWCKDAAIYEVNIRQYTQEGTFKAFEKHLPRLKELGVKILWLMPIHPIGLEKRKGALGSYYSIKDYTAVNPEFGTMDDFKELVKKCHELGFYVILDWVANHTAWDHAWVKTHPEWYTLDRTGNMTAPIGTGWEDVADLDYSNPALWEEMIKALTFWVKEADVDGFRCDVAGFVPTNFWIHVRKKLDAIKPVFMLAEWESRDMHQAFDMTYAWRLWDIMHQIAKGYKNAGSLSYYFTEEFNAMPLHNIRMNFIENHDKNSWEGTVGANFGKAEQTFIVLTCLAQGMPLIYSGQEAGLNKPLAFFEKDLIPWQEHPNRQLFQELLSLKKSQKALWNGEWGGAMLPVNNSHPEKIAVFVREKENNRVVIILNCSNEKVSFTIQDKSIEGSYTDAFAKTEVTVYKDVPLTLEAWKYLVLIQ